MSYATGSATTIDNLMAAVLAFAVANAGMAASSTTTAYIPVAGGSDPLNLYNIASLSKSGRYWYFRWRVDALFVRPSISSSGTWEAMASKPQYDTQCRPLFPPFTSYHLFTEGTVVHVAIEMSNGSWTHVNFGDITKYGTFTGGHYLATMYSLPESYSGDYMVFPLFGPILDIGVVGFASSSAYLPYNGKNYASFGSPGSMSDLDPNHNVIMATGQNVGVVDCLIADQPNVFNDRATGPRLEVFLADNATAGSRLWMPLGYIPNIRPINIRDLNAKDIVNTDWMVFPCQSKNAASSVYTDTGNRGWAVRK